MRDFRYILMLLLPLALAACRSPEYVEDRLVTAFEETMFGLRGPITDQREVEGMKGRLAKWRSPLKVAVVEGAIPENVELTRKTLDGLAALSGLEIELLDDDDSAAALTVHFSEKKDFLINGNQQAACYAHTETDDNGWITNAVLVAVLALFAFITGNTAIEKLGQLLRTASGG